MKDTAQNRIKLSQLSIVVAVAERQNFGEAALDLGISQSAVSHADRGLWKITWVWCCFLAGGMGRR